MNKSAKGIKFFQNNVYHKNNKARGQTLQISKKYKKKKIQMNTECNCKNNNLIKSTSFMENISKRNILEEIKNTKCKIQQYENYLRNSLKKNFSGEISFKNLMTYKTNNSKLKMVDKEYSSNQPIDINNIINSINQKYNNNNKRKQKHPNISLINNSLILNYMNKIDNNISLHNSNDINKKLRARYTAIKNTENNSYKNNIYSTSYKTIKVKMKINSSNRDHSNNSKNDILPSINKLQLSNIGNSNSCNKNYGKRNNNSVLKIKKYMSNIKTEISDNNMPKKIGTIKLDFGKNKRNINIMSSYKKNDTFDIERLIDNYIEKKLEKENEDMKKNETLKKENTEYYDEEPKDENHLINISNPNIKDIEDKDKKKTKIKKIIT